MPQFSARGRVARDAIIYTPLFLLCAVGLLLMIVGIWDRAWIGMVLLAVVTFLFGYQSIQALRDLRVEPQTTEGTVARRWSKRDAFIAKSYYITIGKTIFRIPPESYLDLLQGDMVRVVAYPHSGTVLSVERLKGAEPQPEQEKKAEAAPVSGRMRSLRTARANPSQRRTARQDARAETSPGHDEDPGE